MIGDIANKKACAGVNTINSGKLGCLSLFGTPKHLIGLTKGTVILATDDFNIAYMTPLAQNNKLVPLIGASAFEDLSSEDTYSTNSAGVKRLNLKGLPEYKLWFEEGHEFYRELAKMEGFKNYDFMIGDGEGNWLVATNSAGNFRGFSAGHVTPELTQRKVEGGDSEMKGVLVQFLDRIQFDRNYAVLHAEDLDFTPDEVPQVNGTEISYVANPANTDTDIVVDVKLAADKSTTVEGLVSGDFLVTVNGSTNVITGAAEGQSGRYTLTVTGAIATNDVVSVSHWDGDENSVTAENGGLLYRNTLDNSVTAA